MNGKEEMDSAVPHRRSTWAALDHEARSRLLLLVAAAVSFVLSISLWFAGHELQGIFVGLWVPSILALGSFVAPRSRR
jgi:hypothetical protein